MRKEDAMPDFIKNEEEMLKFWQDNNCFDKLVKKNENSGKHFRFLDGPITANNGMGVHHAWNRSLKDIMLKYKAMNGYSAHYQNGFDAQGLWVEVETEKELGLKDKLDNMSFDEKIKLLSSDGMLIKRPLIVGKKIIPGFKNYESLKEGKNEKGNFG